ncbi:hypothetical protein BDN72DRAFT_904844 [Pluteus cervinus]|uniref:Uncharacterized protein n=1 Tax=Pluteus cervinus TaxID=181527 RepID=A0ACD3A4V6_9AGAR|nr:hypothetical protein BDN72DRAFT_904844 [Pluteus cervinus]
MSERSSTRSAADALRDAKEAMNTFYDLPISPPTMLQVRVEKLGVAAAALAPFAQTPMLLKAEPDFDSVAQSIITGANTMADHLTGFKRTPDLEACNEIIKYLDASRSVKTKAIVPDEDTAVSDVSQGEKKDEQMQVDSEGPVPETKTAQAPKNMEGVPTGPRHPGSGYKKNAQEGRANAKRKNPAESEPSQTSKRPRGRDHHIEKHDDVLQEFIDEVRDALRAADDIRLTPENLLIKKAFLKDEIQAIETKLDVFQDTHRFLNIMLDRTMASLKELSRANAKKNN